MSSNVISLKGIKNFKTVQDLKDYTSTQYHTIIELTNKLQEANLKIQHLESLLQNSGPILAIDEKTFKSKNSGELLCELEIEKIFNKAKMHEISLEDTKKLDLLMKNLYLIKNNKKDEPHTLDASLSEPELLALANQKNEIDTNE